MCLIDYKYNMRRTENKCRCCPSSLSSPPFFLLVPPSHLLRLHLHSKRNNEKRDAVQHIKLIGVR